MKYLGFDVPQVVAYDFTERVPGKIHTDIQNCHDGVVTKLRTLRIADTFVVKVSRFCVVNSHRI